MTLKVIDGGKPSAPATNGGAGQAFEQHRFAEALFDALDTKDARTLEQIRARMSKSTRQHVTREQVNATIRHVRDHIPEYGWMVPYVQKGSGNNRIYWVQAGTKTIAEDHDVAFKAASLSYLRGAVTSQRHYTAQVQMLADTDGMSRGDRRFYNKMAGDNGAALTLLEGLLAYASA